MKRKHKQMISLMLSASLTAAATFLAGAAPDTSSLQSASSLSPVSVKTGHYQTTIDLQDGGSLALSKNSNLKEDWNIMSEALKPGSTMLWDGNNTFSADSITSQEMLSASAGSYGVQGVQLGDQAAGVKSYFLFDNEILCAGAGMSTTSGQQLIQVVDNIPVAADTNLSLTTPDNGFRNVLTASKDGGRWASLKDTPVKQNHTRNWLSATSLPSSTNQLEYSYVFGNGSSQDTLSKSNAYCRFNTKGTGTPKLVEFWTQPSDTWQYTLIPGKTTADYSNNNPYQPEAKLLVNTPALQAAADMEEGIVSINKWAEGASTVDNSLVPVAINQASSLTLKKDTITGRLSVAISKPVNQTADFIDVTLNTKGESLISCSNQGALAESSFGDQIILKLDTSKMTNESVLLEIQGKGMETVTGDEHTVIRGEEILLQKPAELTGDINVAVKFEKPDGTFVRNSGYSKKKYELPEGETDGNRKAGDTDASHIVSAAAASNGDIKITAKEKGHVVVVATDASGKSMQWKINVLYEDPANLPQVTAEDYAAIRQRWAESLIGKNLPDQADGAAILEVINQDVKAAWDSYDYKGQDQCPDIPWSEDQNAAGNPNIKYEDDAVEFRPAMKKVLAMAKAWAAEGSDYYHNEQLLKDIIHILDYLCTRCYTPKSQTDNWWTWEIGMPKDLIPALILIYDELSKDQIASYTEALYFFQPDPFHEGYIGTGSTHGQGYRTAQGANLTDCSRTSLGLGILREDNELVYLAQLASSTTFVIQNVENSLKIPEVGYTSGFYEDGSYIDHSYVPYLGAYGIEFLKGAAGLPPLLADTPWEYPEEVQQIFDAYVKEGLLNCMYDGLMLDSLKGRSVSRPAGSNRNAGRAAMSLMLQFLDSVSVETQEEIRSALKAWMEKDPGFLDSLAGAENITIKEKATAILNDDTISTEIEPLHKNFPLMDRAIHRSDDYLLALSMYSERIQNTEIMNDENLYGWHQGSGMTYLYNGDTEQYTTNFWNTVNPLRLSGTTLVSKNIGNGNPDGTGFIQGGDFRSTESWVGGSSIGLNGINGMSVSGKISTQAGDPSLTYSDNFQAKKSWFMFGDEILCLGAGITNSGEDHNVETIVENRHLSSEGNENFQINGEIVNLPTQEANVKDIVEGTVDVSGQTMDQVSWAHLEGKEANSSIGYYFPGKDTTLSVRKGSNTGDWADIGTSEGKATENYLELWFDHGASPQDAAYSYVLLPGMTAEETALYAGQPQITILSNTETVQAAYSQSLNLMGANFWKDEKTTVGDLTVNKQASVMTQEDENGVLTIAVSDPTMKNTGSIVVELNRPVADVLDHDSNVTVEETRSGVKLTIKTKNTNGASSYAKVQLAASIQPEAVTSVPGDTVDFTVNDYANAYSDIIWRVEGTSGSLDPDTSIDSDGHLTIASTESNTGLLVHADLNETTSLQAFVSLGGEISQMPEEMKELAEEIDKTIEAVEYADDLTDPAIQKMVRDTLKELQSASNDDLARYLMDRIIRLEQTYIQTLEATDLTISNEIHLDEALSSITHVTIEGAALSIPWNTTAAAATSSNATKRADASHDIHVIMDIQATPSNASFVNATSSDAEKAAEKADAPDVLTANFQLKLQKDSQIQPIREYTAPVNVQMNVDGFDPASETMTALWKPENGKAVPLALKIDPDTAQIRFTLTGNGQITFTKESAPLPDEVYQVTLDDGLTGGYLTASPLSGKAGTRVTVKAIPDSGYQLNRLFVNGTSVSVQKNQYTFSLKEDTEITADFTRKLSSSSDEDQDDSFMEPNILLESAGKPSYAVSGTWSQSGDQWHFYLENGELAKSTWICTLWNGIYEWFYFDENGIMKTGWLTIHGQTYYLQPVSNGSRGVMLTGWQRIDGTWYYFNPVSNGTRGALKQ